MKRLLSGLLLVFAASTAQAQPGNMVFTVFNEPYIDLTNPTIVTTADWDDLDANFPLGFNYSLLGTKNDSVFMRADVSGGSDIQLRIDSVTTRFGLALDLMDRSTYNGVPSSIGYSVEQVGGSSIAKLQWKDAGFFDEQSEFGTVNDSVNVQMWLYEEGHLEFRFGSSYLQSPDSILFLTKHPLIYITPSYDPQADLFDIMYYVSSAAPAKVDSIDYNDFLNVPALGLNSSWPANSTVFRFSAPITDVDGVQLNDNIKVYPTVFSEQISIDIKQIGANTVISLISMDGKVVYHQKAVEGKNILTPSSLVSGNYILNVRNAKGSVFYKVIKN